MCFLFPARSKTCTIIYRSVEACVGFVRVPPLEVRRAQQVTVRILLVSSAVLWATRTCLVEHAIRSHLHVHSILTPLIFDRSLSRPAVARLGHDLPCDAKGTATCRFESQGERNPRAPKAMWLCRRGASRYECARATLHTDKICRIQPEIVDVDMCHWEYEKSTIRGQTVVS